VKEKRLVQPRSAEDWMELSQTPSNVRRKIRRMFMKSMKGDTSGQNVRLVDGQIVFDLNYRIFVLSLHRKGAVRPERPRIRRRRWD
jgi:hypothetical protein